MASRTMISGSRRSPDHPSHPPRNLTRTLSEIRPSQTLNPSAPSFIPTSFEKQSSVRHKTPPHKLCSLNICHVNIRSLLAESRLIELESLCAAQNIDVLCLSETWLSPSRAKPGASLVNIPGFQPPFRRDRLHGRGGGVAVYVRNGLNAVSTNMLTDLECVKITLHLPGKEKVSVVAVYRPPILTVPRSSLNWTPSSLQETLTVTLPVSSVTLTPSSQLGGMVSLLTFMVSRSRH